MIFQNLSLNRGFSIYNISHNVFLIMLFIIMIFSYQRQLLRNDILEKMKIDNLLKVRYNIWMQFKVVIKKRSKHNEHLSSGIKRIDMVYFKMEVGRWFKISRYHETPPMRQRNVCYRNFSRKCLQKIHRGSENVTPVRYTSTEAFEMLNLRIESDLPFSCQLFDLPEWSIK